MKSIFPTPGAVLERGRPSVPVKQNSHSQRRLCFPDFLALEHAAKPVYKNSVIYLNASKRMYHISKCALPGLWMRSDGWHLNSSSGHATEQRKESRSLISVGSPFDNITRAARGQESEIQWMLHMCTFWLWTEMPAPRFQSATEQRELSIVFALLCYTHVASSFSHEVEHVANEVQSPRSYASTIKVIFQDKIPV